MGLSKNNLPLGFQIIGKSFDEDSVFKAAKIIEENSNFNKAGCVPQSENFKQHIKMFEPNCEMDIVEPGDDSVISKIITSLKKYDGIILTGSTLRIDDFSNEIKKHIDFS